MRMKMRIRPQMRAIVLFTLCTLISCTTSELAPVSQPSIALSQPPEKSRYQPVEGRHGMVVSDDREASEWGVEILRKGGNAIDAAVATAFFLAVTRPHFASLGGGGFLLYCPKPENK